MLVGVVDGEEYSHQFHLQQVLEEIKADARSLAVASFKHENRASNSEAHRLARFAISSSIGRQVWLFQPRDGLCIQNLVI